MYYAEEEPSASTPMMIIKNVKRNSNGYHTGVQIAEYPGHITIWVLHTGKYNLEGTYPSGTILFAAMEEQEPVEQRPHEN